MENKKLVLIAVSVLAVAFLIYIFTRSNTELFSGSAGLGSGLSVAGIGPTYEGFEKEKESNKTKEGFCGTCS